MITDKRKRGRPPGSGINDSLELSRVADLLIRNSSMSPSAAMKKIMQGRKGRETPETLLRRWQGKWKTQSSSFMAAAQQRSQPKPSVRSGHCYHPTTATERVHAEFERTMRLQQMMDRETVANRQLATQNLIDRALQAERMMERQAIIDRQLAAQNAIDRAMQAQRMMERQAIIDRQLAVQNAFDRAMQAQRIMERQSLYYRHTGW